MDSPPPAPVDRSELLSLIERSQQNLYADVAALDDDATAADSALPGWSRGHALSHIARNAETFTGMLTTVRPGHVPAMYGGDSEARNADIARGAGRPAAEIRADVTDTGTAFVAAVRRLADEQWALPMRSVRGAPITADDVLVMRWQEVEIHRVDLAVGYHPRQWPAEFVQLNLPRQLPRLAERAPGVAAPDVAPYALLAWLYGRGDPGLPELPPWP